VIFRPSVIFGPNDAFLNLFARLAGMLPVIMLAGANARFQPVYVGDVASAFAIALDDDRANGGRFSLCGPRTYALRELVAYAGLLKGHRPLIVPISGPIAQAQAWVMEHLPGKLLSRDNLASMRVDSVCDQPYPALFGAPTALEDVVPDYLQPERADPAAPFRQRHR